ncbi:MAG TPA: hypothetical protein VKB72_01940 [Steroidobacteraceae bacterium]|nr:hypothetical protein [Steroidobacteraceae bacterium]
MRLRIAMVAWLFCSSSAWATQAANAAAAEAIEPPPELAMWVPVQLKFTYRQLTTTYTCSGLQARVKGLLLKLGARPDLDVRSYGCTKLSGPDPFAGVQIKMNVLEPDGTQPAVPAHWKRVDLLEDRTLLDAAADCELIQQVQEQILPVFAARNVDFNATCQPRSAVPGSTRLRADVLIGEQRPPAPAAQ